MQRHEDFEQLCALTLIGEVSPEEQSLLDAHLEECSKCRETLRGFRDVCYGALPLADQGKRSFADVFRESPDREAFLRRAEAQGVVFSARARGQRRFRVSWPALFLRPYYGAAVTALCLALAAVLALRPHPVAAPAPREAVAQTAASPHTDAEGRTRIADLSGRVAALEAELRQAVDRAAEKDRAAAAAEAARRGLIQEAASLRTSLDSLQKQSLELRAALSAAEASNGSLQQKLDTDARAADDLRAQFAALTATRETEHGTLAAQSGRLQELSEQVRLLQASADRDRELLVAGRDIRDLMGARNLHILDVHDVGTGGKDRKSFGRVFYTEGKSLIFYAFDLPAGGTRNVAFQAWGQKDWNVEQPFSLGIFYVDDQKQSRWVLKVDDPRLLGEINSVFVTVERPGGVKHPTGQKLLFASFINRANHP